MNYDIRRGYAGAPENTKLLFDANRTVFTALAPSDDAGYWVEFGMDAPVADTYIMVPACAYNGNRFEAVERKYPPMFLESEFGLDAPVRMTQVPRLAKEGDSFMDVTTGDMTAPCVCVLNQRTKQAFMVFFNQGDHHLNHGVTLEQTGDRLCIRLRAPAKRRLVYRWYDGVPSLRENPAADAPLKVEAGTETTIPHRVFTFSCEDIPALYRAFFEKRSMLFGAKPHANLPFSAFWDYAEAQLNAEHFVEDQGLYTLNARDGRDQSHFGFWQVGWVGGGMSTLALICEGGGLSRRRAVRTLEFMARHQSEAGWYYGIVGADGKVYHDCFKYYEEKYNLLLIRKHADAVYFLYRQIAAMEKLGMAVPTLLRESGRKAADALVQLWQTYGQLGQFVNAETGEIVVGGSTSGAMAPAALCAAALVTGEARYLAAAKEIGESFYRTATALGVTTGGPGEILQPPDSESAAALLESYTALYEADGDAKWLGYACDAAHQLASWVAAYDYEFPAASRFGKMGIRAAGSVWANVQNKHSAPGLCTVSPVALLKLYRATGDEQYLELMRQIARFMPQVASYPERPMQTVPGSMLKPGEICERVNMSDWEGNENVGDSIFGSSSWPEASLMLTWLDVPGVYVVPSRGVVCASDHVNAWLDGGVLHIQNPTGLPARVKVLIDDENSIRSNLGLWWQNAFQRIEIAAGQCAALRLPSPTDSI